MMIGTSNTTVLSCGSLATTIGKRQLKGLPVMYSQYFYFLTTTTTTTANRINQKRN